MLVDDRIMDHKNRQLKKIILETTWRIVKERPLLTVVISWRMEGNSSKKGLELLTSTGIRFNSICSFTESQFCYCPLNWMLHSREVNDKINHSHEPSLQIVYRDNSSFEDLLKRDKSFTIDQRNICSLAI